MRIVDSTDFVKDTEAALAILYLLAIARRRNEREAVMGVQREASPGDMIGESILVRAIGHLELELLSLVCEDGSDTIAAVTEGHYTLPVHRIFS